MGVIWKSNSTGGWEPVPLEGTAVALADLLGARVVPGSPDGHPTAPSGVLRHYADSSVGETWVLLADPRERIYINGHRVQAGIQVLQDRDEIRCRGFCDIHYSTERSVRVVAFPGADHRLYCPRCQKEIQAGMLAVRCPNPDCQVWHHQMPDRGCWLYSDTCALCGQATAFGQGYRWRPEEE